MQRSNLSAAFLLGLALTALSSLTAAPPQRKARPEATPGPTQVKEEKSPQPRMEVFADRTALKVGEDISLTVWVEYQATESTEVKILYAAEHLQLVGRDSEVITLPQNVPLTFTFKGLKAGKSNLLVRASGKTKDKNEPFMVTQKINGIEVQEQTYSLKSILSNSLFGALFGVLLTFAATTLSDRRQRRKEATQRKQWLTATLPAQIELHRLAINKSQKIDPEMWLSKMMTDGIYKDLQELTRNRQDFETLVNDVIETGALLREYERARVEDRAGLPFRQNISAKLENVINKLRSL